MKFKVKSNRRNYTPLIQTRYPLIIMLIMLPFLLIFMYGCSPDVSPIPQPKVHFLVQKEPYIRLLVELSGRLETDNGGYIRINDTTKSILIIWPYGYSFEIVGKETWIINDNGQKLMGIGDEVKIEGGFIDKSLAEERIGVHLPEDANGPYFLANSQ
jgi:hypothetical protein